MASLSRAQRIGIVVAALLLTPVLLVFALLLFVQSEMAERWVENRVSARIDREVQVEGISLHWGWPVGVSLERLRIGNPRWAQTPNLVHAEGVMARVEIRPLFDRRLVMPYLSAKAATAGLEVEGDKATWRFGGERGGESPFRLARVALEDGHIVYRDENEKTALDFKVTGSLGEAGELKVEGKGRFRGEATKGTATVARLEPEPGLPIPIDARARVGNTDITAKGVFAPDLDTVDTDFTLGGHTLRDLQKVFGMNLPDTPPYRLKGHLKHAGNEWVFSPFSGKVGDSDLRGTVNYRTGGKRPLFKADLKSSLLDFDDLGPIIGAPPKTGPGETAAPQHKAKAAQLAVSDKVLPQARFNTGNWGRMDADVKLEAKKVLRPKQLPIDSLVTHVVLKDSVMRFEPLNFGVAGGRVTSHITLDGTKKPARGDMNLDVQGIQLSRLFPEAKTMDQSFGTLYGRGKLVGHGESVASLLGTSDGQIQLAVDGGQVSQLLTELLEIDVARAAMLLGTRKQQVELRCAAGGFEVKDGVAKPENFVVDTTETFIQVRGQVDLGDEKLAIETKGQGKKPSPFTLRSPIVMEGGFRKPKVHPKAGPIAAQVGAAVALGAVAAPLAVVPFLEPGSKKEADCPQLLAEVRAKGAVKKTG